MVGFACEHENDGCDECGKCGENQDESDYFTFGGFGEDLHRGSFVLWVAFCFPDELRVSHFP